jgi:hypothetical protein
MARENVPAEHSVCFGANNAIDTLERFAGAMIQLSASGAYHISEICNPRELPF